MDGHTYTVNQSILTIRFGDISASGAEVLVSTDDGYLSHGGGVSAAIFKAAGDRLAADADKVAPAEMGEVVVTSAGSLAARYILHAITIAPHTWDLPDGAIVRRATQRVMSMLPLLGCRSVAFPAIGSGAAGVSFEVVAGEMASVLVSTLLATPESFEVELYLHDRSQRRTPEELFDLFTARITESLGLEAAATAGGYALEEPPVEGVPHDPHVTAPGGRQRGVFEMLQHLNTHRNSLETRLIDLLRGDKPCEHGALEALRKQLTNLEELRQIYAGELGHRRPAVPATPDSIFLSSTFTDLESHRRRLKDVIQDLGLRFVGMEEFIPAGQAPADYIRQRVVESRLYVGVVGMRYGFVDPASSFSMTELEYRQAVASGKDRYMFEMDKKAPLTLDMIEPTSEGYAKLLDFRERILQANVCKMFTDENDLAAKAKQVLGAWKGST